MQRGERGERGRLGWSVATGVSGPVPQRRQLLRRANKQNSYQNIIRKHGHNDKQAKRRDADRDGDGDGGDFVTVEGAFQARQTEGEGQQTQTHTHTQTLRVMSRIALRSSSCLFLCVRFLCGFVLFLPCLAQGQKGKGL